MQMIRKSLGTASIGLAMMMVMTAAQRASALSCTRPGFNAPAFATDVPTNTRIWCSGQVEREGAAVLVTDPYGVTLPGTQTRIETPGFGLIVFRPDSELLPDSDYQVVCPADVLYDGESEDPGELEDRSFSFRTGAGARLSPPALPNLSQLVFHASVDPDWGDADFADFAQVSEPGLIVVLDRGRAAALNSQDLTGTLTDAEVLGASAKFAVGDGPCGGNWPEADAGQSTTVALGVFDVTGAFSGWSDVLPVTLPEAPAPEPTDVETTQADVDETTEPSVGVDNVAAGEALDEFETPEPSLNDVSLSAAPSESASSGGCQLGVGGASPLAALQVVALFGWLARRRRGRASGTD